MKFFVLSAVAALSSLAACGDPNGGNGVNDVKAACEARLSWTNNDACRTCQVSAISSPDCDCKRDEYRGLCEQQVSDRVNEPDCVFEIDQCMSACGDDCACVDGCFANNAACKPKQAALDGCVTDVCADACK